MPQLISVISPPSSVVFDSSRKAGEASSHLEVSQRLEVKRAVRNFSAILLLNWIITAACVVYVTLSASQSTIYSKYSEVYLPSFYPQLLNLLA